MKIAIIGPGNVGGSLGKVWAKAGHYIIFGVRNPAQDKEKTPVAEIGAGAACMNMIDAAVKADIIVLVSPWPAVPAAIKELGDLSTKVVIDCTNPLALDGDGSLSLAVGATSSGAEEVEQLARGAAVVKAFNTYGWENYANPEYPNSGGLKPVMFYCGDNDDAKAKVHQLVTEVGFEPVDAGGLGMARSLEPLALLWLRMSIRDGKNPNFAWARLTR